MPLLNFWCSDVRRLRTRVAQRRQDEPLSKLTVHPLRQLYDRRKLRRRRTRTYQQMRACQPCGVEPRRKQDVRVVRRTLHDAIFEKTVMGPQRWPVRVSYSVTLTSKEPIRGQTSSPRAVVLSSVPGGR